VTKNAAGNRLAATIKYLSGAVSIGLSITAKYRTRCLCVDPEFLPNRGDCILAKVHL
jgi:hypothetical protein